MKERLDRQTIALRVAKEFEDGAIVNLGGGIPALAANYVPEGRTVVFHAENGVLGFEKRYHASGHASGEDITWAIEQIDPEWIVPVHTEAGEWFARSFENVVLVDEGKQYKF